MIAQSVQRQAAGSIPSRYRDTFLRLQPTNWPWGPVDTEESPKRVCNPLLPSGSCQDSARGSVDA
jgi:hypothetical protein